LKLLNLDDTIETFVLRSCSRYTTMLYRTKYLTRNHHAYNHVGYFNFQSLLIYIIIKNNSIKPSLTTFLSVTLIFWTKIFISLSGLEFSTCMFDSQSDLVAIAVVYLVIIPTGRVVTFLTILSIGKKYYAARERISVEEECISYPSKYQHTIRLIHFYFFKAQLKRHKRIRFIQTPGFISQNRSGDVSRKPAKNATRKHFQSAESFIAARDVFFCIPVSRGRRAFSISRKAIIGVAAPIRQHVNEHAATRERVQVWLRVWPLTLHRRQFRNIISEILACRGCVPRKKEVTGLPG